MTKTHDDFMAETEGCGDNIESMHFSNLLKIIDDDDPDFKELVKEVPSVPTLLRAVHKAGFWAGTNYGKEVYLKADNTEFLEEE
jgi:hypothetical protein